MKVVAFNGSARKDGNTAIMIQGVLAELEKEGIETHCIDLAGKKMHGCIACMKCHEKKNRRCVVDNDFVNECIAAMDEADAIILGSPTYFATMTTEMKALVDRAGMVAMANNYMYARKVGASVVVARRGGAIHTFDAMNHFFQINQMVMPSADYWNMGFGLEKGDVQNDAEGMGSMKILGSNMAWLLKKLHA